jgi:hypothetical protein
LQSTGSLSHKDCELVRKNLKEFIDNL